MAGGRAGADQVDPGRPKKIQTFPTGREEKRRVLMDAVETVRETLLADAAKLEDIATLPQKSVDALYDSGLLRPSD